jgi:hypothetical protein
VDCVHGVVIKNWPCAVGEANPLLNVSASLITPEGLDASANIDALNEPGVVAKSVIETRMSDQDDGQDGAAFGGTPVQDLAKLRKDDAAGEGVSVINEERRAPAAAVNTSEERAEGFDQLKARGARRVEPEGVAHLTKEVQGLVDRVRDERDGCALAGEAANGDPRDEALSQAVLGGEEEQAFSLRGAEDDSVQGFFVITRLDEEGG